MSEGFLEERVLTSTGLKNGRGHLWRGGLPPLGREAALKSVTAYLQMERGSRFTTASQPNGGCTPRHKIALATGTGAHLESALEIPLIEDIQ
jgi:hypothetical protein